MSMQLCCVDPQPPQQAPIFPPSDIEKMRAELTKIDNFMKDIDSGTATETTYEGLKAAIAVANEIILSLDNANDFFKIGGFNQLIPLLACSDAEVVAAAAELIADLCQNNIYCQSKLLDFNVMPQLVKLMDSHPDPTVTSKALYALSCLCRHNNDAIKHLEVTNFLSVILRMLQGPDEKLRAKTAFFLSYLATHENFREAFYQADVVGILLKLLKEEQDSSSEHLLSALQAQVAQHKQSRIQCRKGEYHLKDILEAKIQMYGSKGEYEEAKESCSKILDICFHEEKNS